MKFFKKEVILLIVFLLTGFSEANQSFGIDTKVVESTDEETLDEAIEILGADIETLKVDIDIQGFICMRGTNSFEAEMICLENQVSLERVAICSVYTLTYVAEALCLQNKLSKEEVFQCSNSIDELLEQICLIGSETSAAIIHQFEASDDDFLPILQKVEDIQAEMENLLGGYELKFDFLAGGFVFAGTGAY